MKSLFDVHGKTDRRAAVRFSSKVAALIFAAVIPFVLFSCKNAADESDSEEVKKEVKFTPTVSVLDSKRIELVFSREVSEINEIRIAPEISVKNTAPNINGNGKGKWIAKYEFAEELKPGEDYSFSGTAKNKAGISGTFKINFTGFNSTEPKLEIKALQPIYDAKNKNSEYIKLHVNNGGNLSGIEIYSASDNKKVFVFPSIDVSVGEDIVVHMRNNMSGCVDELENDFELSTAPNSSPTARDLWAKNKVTRLGDESDVITVRKSSGGDILDAVLYSVSDESDWRNDVLKHAAEAVATAGLWKPDAKIQNAAVVDRITVSKALVKNGAENEKASWAVCAIK